MIAERRRFFVSITIREVRISKPLKLLIRSTFVITCLLSALA